MSATTYRSAGVDIDAGDQFVDQISPLISQTHRREVLAPLGGYAGLFALDVAKYPDPVLVSTTDGVGTKLKIAFELEKFDTVGQDLVAMCVNDLICSGAEPLFFLDYFATGKLKLEIGGEVLKGIANSLAPIHCSLIGGETAEMPGFYAKGEFDLAGFAVGCVSRPKIIDGHSISIDDRIIGVASSGVHSNGFSLVRAILKKKRINIKKETAGLSQPVGLELLTPTLIYVNPVLSLIQKFSIKAIAHITGGGLLENVPRVLPHSCTAKIEKSKIRSPLIFEILQKWGEVPETEMWRVFNMGVGLVLVVSPRDEEGVLELLSAMNFGAAVIGTIVKRTKADEGVVLV